MYAALGNDSRYQIPRRHIETRVIGWAVVWGDLNALNVGDFFGVTLFDRNFTPVFDIGVEGRSRSRDVERDLMIARQNRKRVA